MGAILKQMRDETIARRRRLHMVDTPPRFVKAGTPVPALVPGPKVAVFANDERSKLSAFVRTHFNGLECVDASRH